MKKFTALLLAAVTAAFCCIAATGCKKNEKTLIVYTEAGFAPFEFKQKGNKEVVGVDMEIAKYIADKYGYKLRVINGNFDTIVAGINEDNALGIAGITKTPKREEAVEFSDVYYSGAYQAVIYLKSDAPQLLEGGVFAKSNFNGKTVVYQGGTTGNALVNEKKTEWGAKTKGFNEYAVALQEVKTASSSTYLVIDSYVAAQFCAKDDSVAYAKIEGVDGGESYAIVAKKGNKELINKVNVCIGELLVKDENGKTQIDKWYEKYDAIEPAE